MSKSFGFKGESLCWRIMLYFLCIHLGLSAYWEEAVANSEIERGLYHDVHTVQINCWRLICSRVQIYAIRTILGVETVVHVCRLFCFRQATNSPPLRGICWT
ncbi:hypothetical protein CONLIGDRAFT_267025 [Coniochaeta ligniaria NRRL 30616]|uniref:Secreted protein n=1 Tax=Coniochaeta ligniaria NRRL 30616 TaxID=1408157 RepID=A0A1J7IXD7_9PEZI|nr:hypothetical protein CONLIGDRAFT_267025 [Coniochaeta ligniaria NRRL 30616]